MTEKSRIMRYFDTIRDLYNKHIRNKREEPRFLMLTSFILFFILARVSAYSANGILPLPFFHNIYIQQVHVHHLVIGIFLLLVAGFIRIPQFGSTLSRLSSILFGAGAALTLDEFALWLHLDPNRYFGSQGYISLDVVFVFLLLLLTSMLHGTFWRKLLVTTIQYFTFGGRKDGGFFRLFFILCALALILSIGLILWSKTHTQIKSKEAYLSPVSNVAAQKNRETINITPTATPSATPSATPTQIPAGFCLYVPVLMYHHVQPFADAILHGQQSLSVDPAFFDSQMSYLATHGYTSITPDQLVNALRNHTQVPPKSVVITLDDGYLDVFTYAMPILQKYHLNAALMIPTGLLGGQGNNAYFTWGQLKQMMSSGIISVTDHTWSHFPMGSGTTQKDQFEIMTAKEQLEQNLGIHMDVFTYPYGTGAQNPRVTSLLQQDGFLGAFSTIPGTIQCDSYIMALHRTRIGNTSLSTYGL